MTYEQRLEALKKATKKYNEDKKRNEEIEQLENKWIEEDLQNQAEDIRHIMYIAGWLWTSNLDFKYKLWDSGFYSYEVKTYSGDGEAIQMLYDGANSFEQLFEFKRGRSIDGEVTTMKMIGDGVPVFVGNPSTEAKKSFLKEFTNFKKDFYDWFDSEFPFAED